MKSGPENTQVIRLVSFLEASARKNKAPIWAAVARLVSRPARKNSGVNLFKLDKVCKDGDVIVVLAKILAIGKLTKKITVGALKASEKSVSKSGASIITIRELVEKNPSGKNVRIII